MTTALTTEATPTTESAAVTTPAATTEATAADVTAVTKAAEPTAAEGETKTEAKAEEAKSEDKTEAPKGAPEKYEFKAPEGQQPFDSEVINGFSEVAKELNMPQEAAQKILDKVGPIMAQRQEAMIQNARAEWSSQTKADKEFGGDKLDENLGVAKKAFQQFATPELTKLLDETGLGDHPEVIRLMYRAGKAISEDNTVVRGSEAAKTEPKGPGSLDHHAKVMYPSQP
jgi:hypothetical protein